MACSRCIRVSTDGKQVALHIATHITPPQPWHLNVMLCVPMFAGFKA
jgi:hypothetical protein